MDEIRTFCDERSIDYSSSMDSYYFIHNGEHYRVSNHTVSASNRGAYDEFGQQIRPKYHHEGYNHEITASKTRIKEIYNAVIDGKTLDKRGRVI